MKINILGGDGSIEFPPLRYGGSEKIAFQVAKEAALQGLEATLYWGGSENSVEWLGDLRIVRVKTDCAPLACQAFSRPRGACFSAAVAKILSTQPRSIIHAHHAWFAKGIAFSKPRHKLLFTVHCPYHPRFRTLLGALHPGYWSQRLVNDQIQAWFFLKNSDHVTYVSNAAMREVKSHLSLPGFALKGKGESVIPNCIDVNAYRSEKTRDENYILFVGRLSRVKGLHILLQAFKRMEAEGSDAKLVLAVPLNWTDEREYFSALIRRLGLKNLVIKDNPCIEELKRLYAGATLTVLPSTIAESFGLVVLESWANSKPVVVSDAGALPELVRDGVSGRVVRQDDAGALHAGLLELLEDRRKAKAMGAKGFEELIRKYTPERVAKQYAGVYAELACEKASA